MVAYVATLIIFVAIDFVWLSSMADALYPPTLGDMLVSEFRAMPNQKQTGYEDCASQGRRGFLLRRLQG